MKLDWLLFILVLAMGLVLVAAVMIGESSVGHGIEHPKFKTMDQGGPGLERHQSILWLAWLFGVLEIALFVGCIAFGARRKGRLGALSWVLTIGGILYAGVFTWMVLAYRAYLGDSDPALIGSFPAPTAIMLYGLWPVPTFFVIVYVVMFDRWIFTPDDLSKFRRLVAENRQRSEDGN